MSYQIVAYVHAITGERFMACEYSNHGYGGLYRGKYDLPIDGYPYRCVMERDAARVSDQKGAEGGPVSGTEAKRTPAERDGERSEAGTPKEDP